MTHPAIMKCVSRFFAVGAILLSGLAQPAMANDETRDDEDTPRANAVVRIGGCSGTLITERIVLTAAHCITKLVTNAPSGTDLPCTRMSQQRGLQGEGAWQDPMEFHAIVRARKPVIRFGLNENRFGLGIRAEAYSLPYCADVAMLRLSHPVPSGVATPMPVLVGLGGAPGTLDWRDLTLRHSGWGEAKHAFHDQPLRRTGPVQPWTMNACHLFTLPPLRKDGRRIINGDSGSPLIATDTSGREFVIGVIFGAGIPDVEACGAPLLRVPKRHGAYTPTWRGEIPETDATAIGQWIAHHAPEAALLWADPSQATQ